MQRHHHHHQRRFSMKHWLGEIFELSPAFVALVRHQPRLGIAFSEKRRFGVRARTHTHTNAQRLALTYASCIIIDFAPAPQPKSANTLNRRHHHSGCSNLRTQHRPALGEGRAASNNTMNCRLEYDNRLTKVCSGGRGARTRKFGAPLADKQTPILGWPKAAVPVQLKQQQQQQQQRRQRQLRATIMKCQQQSAPNSPNSARCGRVQAAGAASYLRRARSRKV